MEQKTSELIEEYEQMLRELNLLCKAADSVRRQRDKREVVN